MKISRLAFAYAGFLLCAFSVALTKISKPEKMKILQQGGELAVQRNRLRAIQNRANAYVRSIDQGFKSYSYESLSEWQGLQKFLMKNINALRDLRGQAERLGEGVEDLNFIVPISQFSADLERNIRGIYVFIWEAFEKTFFKVVDRLSETDDFFDVFEVLDEYREVAQELQNESVFGEKPNKFIAGINRYEVDGAVSFANELIEYKESYSYERILSEHHERLKDLIMKVSDEQQKMKLTEALKTVKALQSELRDTK